MPEFIWNGLGLTTPVDWEPLAIERDGLTLSRFGRPVCELKWKRVHGTFSFEKHLKRLTRGNRGAALNGVPASKTPLVWRRSLDRLAESGLQAQSFLWQSEGNRGLGAALHNPNTGLACLVQFFVESEEDETAAAEILAGLRDYTAGQTLPWAMFGLTGRVPAEFVMETFSFKPGQYRVVWWRPASGKIRDKVPPGKGLGTRLCFERFAPASVLLKSVSLADWIGAHLELAPPVRLPLNLDEQPVLSWRGAAKTSLLRRALRREIAACGRVWTASPGNCILAVTAMGVVPVAESVFNTVCGSFALVPEEAS